MLKGSLHIIYFFLRSETFGHKRHRRQREKATGKPVAFFSY